MTHKDLGNLQNDVTLICIDCVNSIRALNAIKKCTAKIKFENIKLLTSLDCCYENTVKIEPITSIREYNSFCLNRLHEYVDTSHCLVIQYDGYILNENFWDDKWFEFDYIGSPFFADQRLSGRVGNGGFSLRSKKLLEICHQMYENNPIQDNEDYVICILWRELLQKKGIVFGDTENAKKFGSEQYEIISTQFGFHNKRYAIERALFELGIEDISSVYVIEKMRDDVNHLQKVVYDLDRSFPMRLWRSIRRLMPK